MWFSRCVNHFYPFPVTACPHPVEPPKGSPLEVLDWDGDIIPINRTLSFGCKNGKRFEVDLERKSVEATCVGGVDWIEPDDWGRCVESKYQANGNYIAKATLPWPWQTQYVNYFFLGRKKLRDFNEL